MLIGFIDNVTLLRRVKKMKKVRYEKTANGQLIFEIAGFIFILDPDCNKPINAINDDIAVFDPASIVAVDNDIIVIAQ